MALKKSTLTKNTEYTVTYGNMRGVDLSARGAAASRYRFSYLENMYRDYSSGGDGITESVPGFRKVLSSGAKIHSIFTHKDGTGQEFVVYHAGASLFRFASSARDGLSYTEPIATLQNDKSCAFSSGSDLYVLDGKSIIKVDGDGVAARVGEDVDAYLPTTYVNGEKFEQRNLLNDGFRETFTVTSAHDCALSSDGLIYKILSTEDKTCAVSGIDENVGGAVYVPSFTALGEISFRVTEISDKAFMGNAKIEKVILSDNIKRIGKQAFYACKALKEVVSRDGLETVDNNAFLECSSLTRVYLGAGLISIGVAAFSVCTSLKSIDYALSETEFLKIAIDADLSGITVNYSVVADSLSIEIPIHTPAVSVESISVGGANSEFSLKYVKGLVTAAVITADIPDSLDGTEIVILGKGDPSKDAGRSFITENGERISGADAIKGCRVCECFDGRVFLAGNPALPNTVFYTSRSDTGGNDPTYFGANNFFNDGVGGYPVISMLAAADSLAVFKAGDDGCGSIYYHTPKDTSSDFIPRIYPVSYIHSGVSALGDAISFFDDPIFLSSRGCCSLGKRSTNLDRSISVRSSNINPSLLSEKLSDASMATWCGYLVIQAADHIYLADSRQTFTGELGGTEYEWYYLTGIGSYTGAVDVYRYAESAPEGYSVHPTKAGEKTESSVYIAMLNGEAVYFVRENGIRYAVATDGERRGGSFHPATCICTADGDLLYFGTENGDICVFNNDKRGKPPKHLSSSPDFDGEDFALKYSKSIHPYYYSHNGHAVRYALTTVLDDGGFPHLTKNTKKGSLTIKLRSLGNSTVVCEAATDRSGYKELSRLDDRGLDFSDLDFGSLTFANTEFPTLSIREKERGWIEKSISLYSDSYASPFGVCSITYRFAIKGKIKS